MEQLRPVVAPDDDAERARLQYVVADEGHWVFAGSGLRDGDSFGVYDDGKQTVVGSETDVKRESSPRGFTTLAGVEDGDSSIATSSTAARTGTSTSCGGTPSTVGVPAI